MRFLVDRCAGRLLANWLRGRGYDVVEALEFGADPGDAALLERAPADDGIPVTIDTDFGGLVHERWMPHAGLVRLPDVPAERRMVLMRELIERHRPALETRAVVTVRGDRVRVSRRFPVS